MTVLYIVCAIIYAQVLIYLLKDILIESFDDFNILGKIFIYPLFCVMIFTTGFILFPSILALIIPFLLIDNIFKNVNRLFTFLFLKKREDTQHK